MNLQVSDVDLAEYAGASMVPPFLSSQHIGVAAVTYDSRAEASYHSRAVRGGTLHVSS